MNDGPPKVVARFPFVIPIRCPLDGGQLEMVAPNEVKCVECGATQRKLARAAERLRAVTKPEASDIEKAAQRAGRLLPAYAGTHWYELHKTERRELIEVVKVVVKTLKAGSS